MSSIGCTGSRPRRGAGYFISAESLSGQFTRPPVQTDYPALHSSGPRSSSLSSRSWLRLMHAHLVSTLNLGLNCVNICFNVVFILPFPALFRAHGRFALDPSLPVPQPLAPPGRVLFLFHEPAGRLILLVSSTSSTSSWPGASPPRAIRRQGRGFWSSGVALNLGILAFFKYANFISDLFRPLFGWLQVSYPRPLLRLVVPLGLSFYVFKKISYLVDVYRRKLPAERSFPRLALYISFFPALQAGPIDRAGELMAQFPAQRRADPGRLVEGSQLIIWGCSRSWSSPIASASWWTRSSVNRRASRVPWSRWPRSVTPGRSTAISPPTPTWPGAWAASSASG